MARSSRTPDGHAIVRAFTDLLFQFLKSLQVLPAGSPTLAVDELGHPRNSPFGYITGVAAAH